VAREFEMSLWRSERRGGGVLAQAIGGFHHGELTGDDRVG
jgi:hypothetical protein